MANFVVSQQQYSVPVENSYLTIVDKENYILGNIATKTPKQIAEELTIPIIQVRKICNKNGINLAELKHKKYLAQIGVDIDFFKKESSEMFWILGWLTTDGNVTDNGVISIGLHNQDTDCEEKIRNILAPNKKLHFHKHGPYVSFNYVCKEHAVDLLKWGITPRKSLTFKPSESIPFDYQNVYLRGVLEGDGCICLTNGTGTLGFNGTDALVTYVSKVINAHLGLPIRTKYYAITDELISCANIKYPLKSAIIVGNWLYAETTEATRMNRKYNKYLDLITLQNEKDAWHADRQWSAEEDVILRENYTVMYATELVKKIPKKSVDSIRKRIYTLELPRKRKRLNVA